MRFRHSPSLRSGTVALGLLVLGMRLAVLAYAGSPLPYYDQWFAEYNNVFLQIVAGPQNWPNWFVPHNEHLPLTARAISLLGLLLNGYWDVPFLCAASAVVRAIEAALWFTLLAPTAKPRITLAVWIACAVVFATPISGYNLLSGLQISFFFAELALVAALFSLQRWSSWRSGLGLVAASAFGLCSMGSAIAIPAATAAAHVISRRARSGFWPAWSFTAILSAAYVILVTHGRGNRTAGEPLLEKALFFLQLLSWPVFHAAVGVIVVSAAVFGLWRWWRSAAIPEPALVAAIALAVFAAQNLALIALNRPPSDFNARHWDSAALLPLAWVAIVASLRSRIASNRSLSPAVMLVAAAAIVAFVPVWQRTWEYIGHAHLDRDHAITYYRQVFTSRSRMAEESVRINDMLAARDYSFFDDRILRFTPHPLVFVTIADAPLPTLALLAPELLPTRAPSVASKLIHSFIKLGWMLIPVGGALAIITARRWRRDGDAGRAV